MVMVVQELLSSQSDRSRNNSVLSSHRVSWKFSIITYTHVFLGDLAQIERDIKRITLDVYKKTDEEFLKQASRQ